MAASISCLSARTSSRVMTATRLCSSLPPVEEGEEEHPHHHQRRAEPQIGQDEPKYRVSRHQYPNDEGHNADDNAEPLNRFEAAALITRSPCAHQDDQQDPEHR